MFTRGIRSLKTLKAIYGLAITGKVTYRNKEGQWDLGKRNKDKVLNQYSVSNINECFDGILVICLQHKTTDFQLTLINVYLPHKNSV